MCYIFVIPSLYTELQFMRVESPVVTRSQFIRFLKQNNIGYNFASDGQWELVGNTID